VAAGGGIWPLRKTKNSFDFLEQSWNACSKATARKRRHRHDLEFTSDSFEPEGREFESLRARHLSSFGFTEL